MDVGIAAYSRFGVNFGAEKREREKNHYYLSCYLRSVGNCERECVTNSLCRIAMCDHRMFSFLRTFLM